MYLYLVYVLLAFVEPLIDICFDKDYYWILK